MIPEFVKTMNAIAEGTPKDIQAATDDLTFERKSPENVKLYRVSDEGGELQTTEVGKYPLKRELLESKVQSFIVRPETMYNYCITPIIIMITVLIYFTSGCLHSGHWCWWYLCLAWEWRYTAGEESCLQECCGKLICHSLAVISFVTLS